MTVLAFLLIVGACAAMVAIHRKTQERLADAVLKQQEALEAQRVAQYKQSKAFQQELARSDRATRKLADESRKALQDSQFLREDTQALKDSLHAVLRDPRVQRLLDDA